MKLHDFTIIGIAASTLISITALAQTKPDADKAYTDSAASAVDPSAGAQKQHTQGSAGVQAPQYGGAQKQHTQGSAGVLPQQYGTDWARSRKQLDGQ
nr:hypothetical protein [uncultured Rhodopila sp.]